MTNVTSDLNAGFRRLSAAVKQSAKREIAAAAAQIETDAKQALSNADPYPVVNTGRLRASYRIEFGADGLVARVGTNVEYAPYIEHGTGPHWPPLRPLVQWATRKFSLGRSKQGQSLAYGIARKIQQRIAERGTPAKPHLGPAYERAIARLKSWAIKLR